MAVAGREENKMRKNLKEARQKAGMTQKEVAEKLRISITAYQNIEYGKMTGSIRLWDSMEDLFHINQRKLRELNQSVLLNNQESH